MSKMRERCSLPRLHLNHFLFATLMFHFLGEGCLSLNPEGLALLKFRARVEADPHGVMGNWDPRDGDPCNWNGIRCSDGKVSMLNLKELSLRGTLGPELGSLGHLRTLVLANNEFAGVIPKEISHLMSLEILDLRNNNLSGKVPEEIEEMHSLKHLLLCNNSFLSVAPLIQKPSNHLDEEINLENSCDSGSRNVNSKVRHRPKSSSSSQGNKRHGDNLSARLPVQFVLKNPAANLSRRRLLQDGNLAAITVNSAFPTSSDLVPSTGSGSFPAVMNPNGNDQDILAPAPAPVLQTPSSSMPSPNSALPKHSTKSSKKSLKWVYVVVLPLLALLVIAAVITYFMCQKKGVAAIGPWKTGLSGQLQKAFVTGVPKLQRPELQAACEDFSNIVVSYPHFTVYKGTLSNGVEIAVVSTAVKSAKDWTKHSEGCFRKKIATLSGINHKNFVNLIGYCEEEEPFMRMMVLEYSPNGTLYEHLHVNDFDPLDWTARVRIIMGIAYCVQHMHELNPPVAHPDLQSSWIMLSEDYAAKIVDISIWKEVISKERLSVDQEIEDHSETPTADAAGNVYSFGLLLLEVISGKLPYSEDQGSLVNLAMECLNDNRSLASMLDPTLKSHKQNELEIICQVIQDCIQHDPKKRPRMREATTRLREVISISPEAASPRLSPLWWAELEILSVEAT